MNLAEPIPDQSVKEYQTDETPGMAMTRILTASRGVMKANPIAVRRRRARRWAGAGVRAGCDRVGLSRSTCRTAMASRSRRSRHRQGLTRLELLLELRVDARAVVLRGELAGEHLVDLGVDVAVGLGGPERPGRVADVLGGGQLQVLPLHARVGAGREVAGGQLDRRRFLADRRESIELARRIGHEEVQERGSRRRVLGGLV